MRKKKNNAEKHQETTGARTVWVKKPGESEGKEGRESGREAEERECDRVVTEGESGALCVSGLCVSLCSCPQAQANISCIK